MRWNSICRRIAVACLCIIAYSWSGGTNSQVIQAKVGLDSFTPDQQQWFWSQVDVYARFDSFLRFCGRDTHFEQRIVAAARDCATPGAIQTARTVFRRKAAASMRRNTPGLCQLPGVPALIANMEKLVNGAVDDVDRACRSCLICKL
jgi:hypothetical protein